MSTSQNPVIPIIYWTKWFDVNQWEGYTIDKCNLPYTCKITHDRTQTKDTSVIIFHASDLTKDMPPLKKDRAWVYHNAESPKNQPAIMDQMQYTMTYRLDADFPWGYLERDYLLREMQKPLENNRVKKVAPVAWIVSNCKASNYRHHYVRELKRWIDVDIYGHCMNNQPFPQNSSTIDLISQYYFYLSIENSNCKDYVTEKLSNAYVAGVVPIVDGPSDYGPFIPNTHSVIRIDDFESPMALASYLRTLVAEKRKYERYLDYRRPGGISDRFKATLDRFERGRCDLCTLAYERQTDIEKYYYPGKKIYSDNTCIAHKHFDFKSTDVWRIYLPLTVVILLIAFIWSKKSNRRKIKGIIPIPLS